MTASMNVPQLRFPEFSGKWVEKTLGEIAIFFNSERVPLTESDRKPGIYPYYGASGIIDYVEGYIFDGEYVLLGEDGANIILRNSRLVFLAKGKFWANNHAHVFQSKESNYFLCEALERIDYTKHNTGTAQPKLNSAVVKGIQITIPSLPEQTKIAAFLSAVDTKIDQLTQKKALLETYKKGAMQKIFSQQIRFKADDGGEYPEWEEKKLGEVAECLDNFRKPLNDEERQRMQGKYPYWGANNIMDYVDQYIFDETIVLLAEDGGNFDEYATRKIANLSHGKCWVNNHTHVLRGINLVMTNEFLYYSLVHKNITGFVSGGTRAKLTKGEMLKIPLVAPSYEEQTKIANFLSAIDRKIDLVSQQLEQAKAFKKGLLQQMFV